MKNDFDESLLTTYEKANEDGLNYWITAEIDPFSEDTKTFVIGIYIYILFSSFFFIKPEKVLNIDNYDNSRKNKN